MGDFNILWRLKLSLIWIEKRIFRSTSHVGKWRCNVYIRDPKERSNTNDHLVRGESGKGERSVLIGDEIEQFGSGLNFGTAT